MFSPRLAFKEEISIEGTSNPWGISCDHKGNLVVSSRTNKLHLFDSQTLKQKGTHFPLGLKVAEGITFSRDGKVLVTDAAENEIHVWNPETEVTTKRFGTRSDHFHLAQPGDVAIDPSDDILVAQIGGRSAIVKFNPHGQFVREFTGDHFGSPHFITVDCNGIMVVSDCEKNSIFILGVEGNLLQTLGCLGSGEGQFKTPAGAVIDKQGNLIVIDNGMSLLFF